MAQQTDNGMARVQRILAHSDYKTYIKKIAKHEKSRKFCGHDMVHFMDVARIAMILNLEQMEAPLDKETIYAAALLHDIGRFVQYEDGTDHAKASAKLAPAILKDCGFTPDEAAVIVEAIGNHRNKEIKDDADLNGLLYRADKLSRPCYGCLMQDECNWKRKKKNLELKY